MVMKTILLSEVEKQMEEVNSISKLRGLNSSNHSVVISPNNLPFPNTGGEFKTGVMAYGKWYRIAIGNSGGSTSSGLFNIGNKYGSSEPRNILFYAFAEGYQEGSIITKIASSRNLPISKARLLYAASELASYLDVYVYAHLQNIFFISCSSLIGFKLQTPEEVSKEIPEGYSVKEFSF